MFPQTLGMFIPACIFMYIRGKKDNINYFKEKKTYQNMVPGSFQAIGNLFLIFSILLNTNAIAAPLTELSVVVATLLGMFYLKEKKVKPFQAITLIGLGLIVIGSLLCGFSKFLLNLA
jgi:glucose uptake protein